MKKQLLLFLSISTVLLVGNWILPQILNPYMYMILIYCGINIILGVSLNAINGLCGQFSIGHAGFMAVGAYVSAFFSFYIFAPWVDHLTMSSPGLIALGARQVLFVAAILIGGGAAALFGYIVGLPSL